MADNAHIYQEGAYLREPDFFPRFRVPERVKPLSEAALNASEPLFVVEVDGMQRALLRRHMVYHHVAEGTLAGKPFVVAWNAADGTVAAFSPVVRSRPLHFSAGGLFEHRALLIDDESHSYWDPRTGTAVLGPLTGATLPRVSVTALDAHEARLQFPQLALAQSPLALRAHAVAWFNKVCAGMEGRALRPENDPIPGDPRLPDDTYGVGVVLGDQARFFPLSGSGEQRVLFKQRVLVLRQSPDGSAAYAQWEDGTRPMQLVAPWSDFAYAFPECSVAAPEHEAA